MSSFSCLYSTLIFFSLFHGILCQNITTFGVVLVDSSATTTSTSITHNTQTYMIIGICVSAVCIILMLYCYAMIKRRKSTGVWCWKTSSNEFHGEHVEITGITIGADGMIAHIMAHPITQSTIIPMHKQQYDNNVQHIKENWDNNNIKENWNIQ